MQGLWRHLDATISCVGGFSLFRLVLLVIRYCIIVRQDLFRFFLGFAYYSTKSCAILNSLWEEEEKKEVDYYSY